MGKNIVLDLNGHTISMTTNFQRQQRFFSLIELASQPFPKGIAGFIVFRGEKGFLIGENFMKSDHPGNTARDFIKKIT